MPRKNLLQWQWSDYSTKHRDRRNLLLHIVAVPLVLSGMLWLLSGILLLTASFLLLGLVCIGVGLAVQGRGHKLEKETPIPFDGPGDAVTRLLAEQWITFPRFVLSGGWYRNWKASA